MNNKIINPLLAALLIAGLGPVYTATAGGDLRVEAEKAIRNLQSADSTSSNLFSNSAGYAVFSNVGKGASFWALSMGRASSMKEASPSEKPP